MSEVESSVAARFRRQQGVITFGQAIEAGLSASAVKRRVAGGTWVRVARGVYRHAVVTPTWRSQLMAACLHLGGVASHRSAALLWELDGARLARPELVVGRTTTTVHRARVHRSTQFDAIEPVRKDGIPTTAPARTLIDYGAVVSWRRFEQAVDDALRRNLVDWPTLLSTQRRLGRRGRNGSAALRALLDERFGDDRIPLSEWGRWVKELLVDSGLPEPLLEYRIHGPDGRFFAQVDLAYPEQRVSVELQSAAYHLHRQAFESDAVRAAGVAALGWAWVPVTWQRYVDDPDGVVRDIARVLRRTP